METKNRNLHKAKKEKNDEFYTQISDIEKELKHYKEHFKGKIIFCNCDDPESSHFWKYFEMYFSHLELKKLISTHYESDKKSYKLEIVGDYNEDGKIDHLDIIRTELKQNGDFRSPESVEILKECDIVVTNPPFSLFREYVAQLIEHDKKFLILGNNNAITYKEIFKLIKEGSIWLGVVSNKTMNFRLHKDYTKWDSIDAEGNKVGKVPAISWFTNLNHSKRNDELILYKNYNPTDFPKYDNYDAINVDKVKEIPCDYDGVMGVPITFLSSYNPDQFEIVGCSYDYGRPENWAKDIDMSVSINNVNIYKRILIKKIK